MILIIADGFADVIRHHRIGQVLRRRKLIGKRRKYFEKDKKLARQCRKVQKKQKIARAYR